MLEFADSYFPTVSVSCFHLQCRTRQSHPDDMLVLSLFLCNYVREMLHNSVCIRFRTFKVAEDMARLDRGVQIVVGTPGRVYDMINRKALR